MVWDERIERNLRAQQEYFEGKKEGIIEGKKEGKKEGIIEGKKEIVINLYQKEIPIDKISEYTNISIREIEKIIKSK